METELERTPPREWRSVSSDRLERSLIGLMAAVALYLVIAGAAEISLSKNAECIETIRQLRLAPNRYSACLSEFQYFLAHSASRGAIGAFSPEAPPLVAFVVMAVVYGGSGALLAQLRPGLALSSFVLVVAAMVAISMAVGFVGQFLF